MSHLNERQKEAVNHLEGPLLILAGAGAGKTKTITERILNLIRKGVSPREILAITFTNKAAQEMKERVKSAIENDTTLNLPISPDERPFVSTFHSLGVYILRNNSEKIGIKKSFKIFDRDDSKKTIREAIKSVNLDPKQFEPGVILNAISREKGEKISLNDYALTVGKEYWKQMIHSVWQKYEETLKQENALDFDDLLLKTALLLEKDERLLNEYSSKWKYLHIDEYQDTNKVQYEIANCLAKNHKNICVVGDIDQNIYSWRGARIANLMNFEKDFPNSKLILLEENYRSTQNILEAANEVIKKNKFRKEKNLFTKNNEGEKIGLHLAFDENFEARFVADKSRELIRNGVKPEEIAVLYRANFQSRVLEESFLNLNVPYQVLGTRFFDRKEIKDILSFLRLAYDPNSTTDLSRVINIPPRGIGKVTLLKIIEKKEGDLSDALKNKVANFKKILVETKQLIDTDAPSEVIKKLIKISGMDEYLLSLGEEGLERIENVKELVTLSKKYDSLPQGDGILKLLEDAALATDQDSLEKKENSVKLMTVHSAKGLEFDYVFIVGLEEGLFPHEDLSKGKSRFNDSNDSHKEEERRLFYVAITRARKKVFLSFASYRTIYGSKQINIPSEFISDIPNQLIEEEIYTVDTSDYGEKNIDF